MIGIDIEGISEVREKLRLLRDGSMYREINEGVAKLIIKEAKKYPAPRRVTRKQAYGATFSSDRQRRYFFAALRSGAITVPYKRSRKLMEGWQVEPFGKNDYLVMNDTEYADYVMGQGQSRMSKMIGWKKLQQLVDKMGDKIRQTAGKIADAYIRRIGLK